MGNFTISIFATGKHIKHFVFLLRTLMLQGLPISLPHLRNIFHSYRCTRAHYPRAPTCSRPHTPPFTPVSSPARPTQSPCHTPTLAIFHSL